MPLVTGTPLGTIESQEELYLDGAPYVYFQEREDGYYEHNPDDDGFYWGLSGTVTKPVYQVGCYEDVSWTEDVTTNTVKCDAVGDKSAVTKRNHFDLKLTLSSLFPLSVLRHMIHGGVVTETAGETEKMGMGDRNNTRYYRVYLPRVYDEDVGDYLAITGHKCQFVEGIDLSMPGSDRWGTPIVLRFYADEDVPSAQKFATIIRLDPSAL